MDQDGEEIVEEIVQESVLKKDKEEKQKQFNIIKPVDLFDSDSKIVAKLEVFLSCPDFIDCMQKFVLDKCKFFERNETGEYSHETYLIFEDYVKLIESCLQDFLQKESIQSNQLYEACKRVKAIDENSLYSLDYVLACTEYEEFFNMMVQYNEIYNYEYEDKDLDFDFGKKDI